MTPKIPHKTHKLEGMDIAYTDGENTWHGRIIYAPAWPFGEVEITVELELEHGDTDIREIPESKLRESGSGWFLT